MEAYLVENEGILELDDPYVDVSIIAEELTLKRGRQSKGTDGRIDLLITYAQEYIGVVELKLGQLKPIHLKQLEDYLSEKDQILTEFPEIISSDVASSPKWIGLMVGTSIDDELAQQITKGYKTEHGDIPIAALIIQRYRSENGNVYILTDAISGKLSSSRDLSKFKFEGQIYGKGRLVLAVIQKAVERQPSMEFAELQRDFPKHIQGSSGIFTTLDDARGIYEKSGRKRHFLKPEELIKLSDITIAVSNQWGVGNICKFISHANAKEFEIQKAPATEGL